MINLIKKNFWIKLFCLVSAAILWIYVAAGQSTVGKYPGGISIRVINVPSGLVAIYDTKITDIKIMADPAVWNKLSAESFDAYIDLSNRAAGTYDLPVTVVSSVPGVQIIERNPENAFVRLETVVTKEVSVSKKVEGTAADGMVAGNIDITPDKVQVKGPKSTIDGITEALVVVRLNGESEKFTKNIPFTVFDENNEQVSDIEFVPSEASVTVPIVKTSNNKTVGIKVKTTGVPKTGFYVSNVTVNPGVIDIVGPPAIVQEVNFVETGTVDLTNLESDTEKDVTLNLTNGIVLQNGVSNKAKVKISISKSDVTKKLTAKINPVNLPSEYKINSYSPEQVEVIVSGSADAINVLSANSVILVLNFQGKNTQDSNISFDLSASSFQVPEGVSVISMLPSAITVSIGRKN